MTWYLIEMKCQIPYCPWQFRVQPFSRPTLDAKLSEFNQGLAFISWPGREIRLAREKKRVRLDTTPWKRFLARPALICPRKHTHKLVCSSTDIMTEPEAATALSAKLVLIVILAQACSSSLSASSCSASAVATYDCNRAECSCDDEMQQQGQCRLC
jgi:hypothetical protein